MPEFDPVQVDRIPKPFEVMQYLYAIQKESTDPKDKTLNDFVSSYTLSAYVKILEAYSESTK